MRPRRPVCTEPVSETPGPCSLAVSHVALVVTWTRVPPLPPRKRTVAPKHRPVGEAGVHGCWGHQGPGDSRQRCLHGPHPALRGEPPTRPAGSHPGTGSQSRGLSFLCKSSCLEAIMKLLPHSQNPRTPRPGGQELSGPGTSVLPSEAGTRVGEGFLWSLRRQRCWLPALPPQTRGALPFLLHLQQTQQEKGPKRQDSPPSVALPALPGQGQGSSMAASGLPTSRGRNRAVGD